ncbi:MAG: cyclodeaminase/cyclohydrolase family protein [Candidatus Anammoxibacter sp.]
MNYVDAPLRKYIEDASSCTPTPGGGSAAALVGALGTAMASMASGYTIGNEKFKDVDLAAGDILDKCNAGRKKLLNMMDEDVRCYSYVTEAYRLPKFTANEKRERTKSIQKALKKAVDVPVKVLNCCLAMLEEIRKLADIANPNLISDVGVAALLTNAALLCGKLNIDINIARIKDETLIRKVEGVAKKSELRAQALLHETMKIVNAKIINKG